MPDRYIVTLVSGTDVHAAIADLQTRHSFAVSHVYVHVLGGFSAAIAGDVLERLRCEPVIKAIEAVLPVQAGG